MKKSYEFRLPINMAVLLCSVIQFQSLQAEIITYKPSGNISGNNPFVMPSTEYRVELVQDGMTSECFVYMMNAMHYTNNSLTTSWVNFSFTGRIKLRVYPLKAEAGYCSILPSSAGIRAAVFSQYVEFEIDRPGQYSVEFEQGIKILHPLLVFANPPEKHIPSEDDPGTIYFGPGLHEIGESYFVPSGKTVYIHGEAYVKGQFVSENTSDVKIIGRGILSGEDYPARSANHMITFNNTKNVLIEGITIVHAPRFNIRSTGLNQVVRNVKMMGWWFSTDGVVTGENGIVEDCFFKVNDDAIKVYNNNTLVRRCVIWQMENGAPFQIGWGGDTDVANFTVYDCDVIRVEHEWDNENLAVFCAIHGGGAHKRHFVFDNIRIENTGWRVFHIITKPNRWANWNPERGYISDIVFRNIRVSGMERVPSLIMGHDENHMIWNILFENLRINNKLIASAEESSFIIHPETTRDIRFIIKKDDQSTLTNFSNRSFSPSKTLNM